MNKTISINLGGRNFFIEEEAYKKLDAYLSAIKARFAAYRGNEEIVADMEARIAEKFTENKQNSSDVITLSDVEKLISELGSVEDIAGEDSGAGKSGEKETGSSFAPKRLMRNGDNKIVAGVASGLAAYFDVDPFWVRLGFGVLIFAWGAIIPIYFLLWVIMPEAKSVTEKMQMRGEPLNLGSIGETIKERAEEFKEHVNNLKDKKSSASANQAKVRGQFGNFFREVFAAIGQVIKFIFKLLCKIIAVVFIVAFSFSIAMLTIALVFMLFNIHSPYVGFPVSVIAHGAAYYVLLICAYVLVVIPLMFIILLAISLLNNRKVLNQATTFALFGTWLLALVIAGGFGAGHVPEYIEQIKNSPELQTTNKQFFDIRDFKQLELSSSIHYKLVEGNEFKITAQGWAMDMDRLEVAKDGDTLKVSRKQQDFCFFCVSGNSTVEITAPAFEIITAKNSSNVDASLSSTSTVVNLNNSSSADINFKGKDITVNLSNASYLKLTGTSDVLKAQLQNASHLDSRQLEVKTADVTTQNASHANVWVDNVLKYNSSNASWITYLGNPKLQGDSDSIPEMDNQSSNYDYDSTNTSTPIQEQ